MIYDITVIFFCMCVEHVFKLPDQNEYLRLNTDIEFRPLVFVHFGTFIDGLDFDCPVYCREIQHFFS